MNIAPLLLSATLAIALGGAARAAALLPSDPRTAINAVNTPGDASAVFIISAPGSYYLVGNLIGEAGKAGIIVNSSDVQIDLMGFNLDGGSVGTDAITRTGGRHNISIKDGRISNWTGFGIQFGDCDNVAIRHVGLRSIVVGGIQLGQDGLVERCSISEVSGNGILTGPGATIADSQILGGHFGILVAHFSIVRDCTVRGCDAEGITAVQSIIRNCTVANNTAGIRAIDSLVVDCHVSENSTVGVRLLQGTLRGCEVSGNGGHGVELDLVGTRAVGNRVASNGGDGIRALAGARIDENEVRSHARGAGIRTFGTGSVVVKNTLLGNAIAVTVPNAGNFVGPLVFVNAVYGRDDPWANIHGN